MKKRCMAILIASAVMLSLAGCSKAETNEVKENAEQSVSVEREEVPEGGEETSAEQEIGGEIQIDEKTETANGPHLDISSVYYDGGEEISQYIYGNYPSVKVTGEEYPELKTAISEWFANYKSNYESEIQKYVEDAKMVAEDMGDDFYSYSLNYSAKAARLDDSITSICIRGRQYRRRRSLPRPPEY